jgi:hypothetical protein
MLNAYFLLLPFALAVLLSACGGDAEPGDDGTGDNNASGNGSGAPTATSTPPSDNTGGRASDAPRSDFCSLLTTSEIESVVGNAVAEGVADVGISCIWLSDPNDTSVSMHLQAAINTELCVNAISNDPTYSEVTGFDRPAFGSYLEPAGGLADIVICLDEGGFQLIVSGGLDDTADEERLRGAARQLVELALTRF